MVPSARTPRPVAPNEGLTNGSTDRQFMDREPAERQLSPGVPPGVIRVTAVIPAKNEERNIAWVLRRIPSSVDEVILVDGRSHDGTVDVARAIRPDIRVVTEAVPGKGAALRAGFVAATGEAVVMLDADGSMDPMEIDRFVQPLTNGTDLVKGSRFMAGGGTSDMTLLRWFGNWVFVKMTNILFRARFSDLCYGYCAFRRDCLAALALEADGFEIETELMLHAVKARLTIAEVPSFEAPRRFGTSNLNTFRDGWRVLRTILRERFSPLTPVSVPLAAPVPARALDGPDGVLDGRHALDLAGRARVEQLAPLHVSAEIGDRDLHGYVEVRD